MSSRQSILFSTFQERIPLRICSLGRKGREQIVAIVDIFDDQDGFGSGHIFVPKWDVLDTDTMHPKLEEQRYVNRDLFRAFELPTDWERYENVKTRRCLELSANLFVKGNAWFNHGLDQQVADEKRLEAAIQKISHLSEQFNNARKEVEVEKKGWDAADAEVSRLKGVESDLLGQIERNLSSHEAMKNQYETDIEEVEVSHYSVGYNHAVCRAKEMDMDYKALLIDPKDDVSKQMMPRLLPKDEVLILGSLPNLK